MYIIYHTVMSMIKPISFIIMSFLTSLFVYCIIDHTELSNKYHQHCADLRKNIAKIVANKSAIAARLDSLHTYPDGSEGMKLREEIEKKLDKLLEPPPVKAIKPLPPPIDVPGKKRGGRSVRKMKERMAVTDFRKAANRSV